ncbi:glycosyl hydrolase [Chitinispirillales bacterium ANBcel5]|uniref:beta-xylosidase n=1 Tax=Cellulosispirillum alkaliphilum TaxID=3039283 RepID=UPI002A5275AF|nr:glycosyl hydrolase [Chitinispirillales bacterium ANBcel5]
MIEAIKLWNEPNNLSHWDFTLDPDWKLFSAMTSLAAKAIKRTHPTLPVVLGGISPIDTNYLTLLSSYGLFDTLDAVAIHGFPLDWNHWQIDEWPQKIKDVESVCSLPVWVTEVGTSSFGADEVQVFGLKRTSELLMGRVERIFWYSLFDLPPAWEATTRHKESEGSSYYRHFYMGLIRADGTAKPALRYFPPEMGICQWFHFEDHRLDFAIECLRKMGVKKLRTGISWADWHRPNAIDWFDKQMEALKEFDITITLCFTPPSRGIQPSITSPPIILEEFAEFAQDVVARYVKKETTISKD